MGLSWGCDGNTCSLIMEFTHSVTEIRRNAGNPIYVYALVGANKRVRRCIDDENANGK